MKKLIENTLYICLVILLGVCSSIAKAEDFSFSGYRRSLPVSANEKANLLAMVDAESLENDFNLSQEENISASHDCVKSSPESSIFSKGGYIHPALAISTEYSDNVFNRHSAQNPEGDTKTKVMPSLWLSVPPSREKLLVMDTSNTSPGGFYVNRNAKIFTQRYHAYFLIQPEIVSYDINSSSDTTNVTYEGLFQYNLKNGLSLDIVDQFKDSEDPSGTGDSATIDKFKTNTFDAKINYYLNEIVSAQFGYSNFDLEYDEVRNSEKNRDDNSFSASIFYHYLPEKVEFSGRYKLVDMSWDRNINSDSKMHFFYAGGDWRVSSKTSIKMEGGYASKLFDNPGRKDHDDIIFNLLGKFKPFAKTSVTLRASRVVKESDYIGSDYALGHMFSFLVSQKFTNKFGARLFVFRNSDHNHGIGKKDIMYHISPSINYDFNKWIKAGLTYTYENRDSNFAVSDYASNKFMGKFTSSF